MADAVVDLEVDLRDFGQLDSGIAEAASSPLLEGIQRVCESALG